MTDKQWITICEIMKKNQYPELDSRKIYRKADDFMYEKKVAMKAARTD